MVLVVGYGPTNTKNTSTVFNHIHHIGEGWLSDMGCVYTLGHQPQSEIRNNVCHDVQSYNYGGWYVNNMHRVAID